MPRFQFAKLVRDNIVAQQLAAGAQPVYRTLDAAEHKQALIAKITEEAAEIAAASPDDVAAEIADVQQALDDLRDRYGVTAEAVAAAQAKKNAKNGAFQKGIYIETVTVADDDHGLPITVLTPTGTPRYSAVQTIAFRLRPGADLKASIERVVAQHKVTAGFIVTCVGGLEQAVVRMAGAKPDAQDIRTFTGDFEIVSLVGTVSVNGVHMHMSFSDKDGRVMGGHLKEGTIIRPTAEIVIGVAERLTFTREPDEQTGFPELVIR